MLGQIAVLPRSNSCTGEGRKGEEMGGKGRTGKGSRGGREGQGREGQGRRGEGRGQVSAPASNVTKTDVAIGFLQ